MSAVATPNYGKFEFKSKIKYKVKNVKDKVKNVKYKVING